jgi:hypothetical protein
MMGSSWSDYIAITQRIRTLASYQVIILLA